LQMQDLRHAAEGVVDRDGHVICLSSGVSETTGGLSLRMDLRQDSAVEAVYRAYAAALARLGHFGPLNLQGKKTVNGEFALYEIIGRFTGSIMARVLQGENHVTQSRDFFWKSQLTQRPTKGRECPIGVQIPPY